MPVARFQMPDGRVARFDVPDGTTPEAATQMMQQHFAANSDDLTPTPPPEKEDPGLLGIPGSFIHGVSRAGQEAKQSADLAQGKTPEVAPPETSVAEEGLGLNDVLHPVRALNKVAYGVGNMLPEIGARTVGGIAGGAIGSLAGPEGTAAGAFVGENLAQAAVDAAQKIGGFYVDALKDTNGDHAAAMVQAAKQAALSGTISAATFGLFESTPFKGAVSDILSKSVGLNNVAVTPTYEAVADALQKGAKSLANKTFDQATEALTPATTAETAAHILMQGGAVQPALAAVQQAGQNVITGKPTGQGVGEAAISGGLGMAIPMAGTHLAGALGRGVKGFMRPKDVVEAPPPPPDTTNQITPPPPDTTNQITPPPPDTTNQITPPVEPAPIGPAPKTAEQAAMFAAHKARLQEVADSKNPDSGVQSDVQPTRDTGSAATSTVDTAGNEGSAESVPASDGTTGTEGSTAADNGAVVGGMGGAGTPAGEVREGTAPVVAALTPDQFEEHVFGLAADHPMKKKAGFQTGLEEALGLAPFQDQVTINKKPPQWQDAYKAAWQLVSEQKKLNTPEDLVQQSSPPPTSAAPIITPLESLAAPKPDLYTFNRGVNSAALPKIQKDAVNGAAGAIDTINNITYDQTSKVNPDVISQYLVPTIDTAIAHLDSLGDNKTAKFEQMPAAKNYTKVHDDAPAINDVQQLSRDAASALGRGDFAEAKTNLASLREIATGPKYMEAHVLQEDPNLHFDNAQTGSEEYAAKSEAARKEIAANEKAKAKADLKEKNDNLKDIAKQGAKERAEVPNSVIFEQAKVDAAVKKAQKAAADEARKAEVKPEVKATVKKAPVTKEQKVKKTAFDKIYGTVMAKVQAAIEAGRLEPAAYDTLKRVAEYGVPPEGVSAQLDKFVADRAERNVDRKPLTTDFGSNRRSFQTAGPMEKGNYPYTFSEYSPEMDAKRAVVTKQLQARLHALGLHDVALRVPDFMHRFGVNPDDNKSVTGNRILGQSSSDAFLDWANREGKPATWDTPIADSFNHLIKVSLESGDLIGSLDHEAIHALRALGLINDKEWSVLTRRAEAENWIKATDVDKHYPDYTHDEQIEEAIAETFRKKATNKINDGFTARVVYKIKQVLEALGNVFRKNGFDTADKVFSRVESGEAGMRDRQIRAAVATKDMADPRTTPPRKLATGIFSMFKNARDLNDGLDKVKHIEKAGLRKALHGALFSLTRNDIVRALDGRIPALIRKSWEKGNEGRPGYVELHDDFDAKRRQLEVALKPFADAWQKQTGKEASVTSDAVNAASIAKVEAWRPLADTLASDKELKELNRDITKNMPEITARHDEIKQVYDAYNALSDTSKTAYKSVFDAYAMYHEEARQADIKRITEQKLDPKEEADLVNKVNAIYASSRVAYTHLGRFGEHWIRVGKGAERYHFESESARNEALSAILKDIKDNPNDDPEANHVEYGTGFKDLRTKLLENGQNPGLSGVLRLIGDKSIEDAELKDRITQMWLSGLPDRSMRKNMLHRRDVPGFSPDVARVLANYGLSASSQIGRTLYSDRLRNALDEARASVSTAAGEDIRPDKWALDEYIKHLDTALKQELTPHPPSAMSNVASLANHMAFLYYLSSPRSGLMHISMIPFVGVPHLMSTFGAARGMKAALKYSNLFNMLVSKNGDGTKSFVHPELSTIYDNMKSKTPALAQFYKDSLSYTEDRYNMSGSTWVNDLNTLAKHPSDALDGPLMKGVRFTNNVMMGVFHHAAKWTRQVMFGAGMELRLDNIPEFRGKTDAQKDAILTKMDPAARKNLMVSLSEQATHEEAHGTLGDYREAVKPLATKLNWESRMATQFMTFPQHLLSYMARNGYNMIKQGTQTAEERRAASGRFLGTMGMLLTFSGITGLPLYSAGMGLLTGLNAMTGMFGNGPDDPYTDEDGNPVGLRDLNLYFREKILPKYFGAAAPYIEQGPLSVLSGENVASFADMDHMFFNGEVPTESAKSYITNAFFADGMGAVGDVGLDIADGLDDMYKGFWERGVEKLMPAIIRNPMKAYRYANEGATTKKGDIIEDATWFNTGKLMAQAAGLSPTELDEVQKTSSMAANMMTLANDRRTRAINMVAMAGQSDNPDDFSSAMDEVNAFNNRYPELMITASGISSVLQNRAKARAMALPGGYETSRKLYPYMSDLLQNPNLTQ